MASAAGSGAAKIRLLNVLSGLCVSFIASVEQTIRLTSRDQWLIFNGRGCGD